MWRSFYVVFRALSGAGFWVERRFTPAGLLLLGCMVLAAVFGVDTSLTVAYRIFTFLAALLAIAFVGAWLSGTPLAVRPQLPHTLTAGEPFVLRLAVRNTTDRPLDGVALRAELADPRPAFDQFRARLRFPNYRGWARLLSSNRVADIDEAVLPLLAARGETEIVARGLAVKRGRLRITGISAARAEPLSLIRKLTPVAGAADICVLPRRYALPPLSLSGTRRHQPGGLPQGASVGDSEEFLGLRDYRPGDARQRIHWRSFARTGKPVVKEFQDEFVARHALILDTFGKSGGEEAFEEAVAVASSFAWTLDTQECLLDLMFVGTDIHTYTTGHGHLLPGRLLEVLAGVQMQTSDGFHALLEAVRAKRELMSGCVCILLDWDDERKALLDTLHASGATVLPLLVSTRKPDALPPGIKVLAPGLIAEGLATL